MPFLRLTKRNDVEAGRCLSLGPRSHSLATTVLSHVRSDTGVSPYPSKNVCLLNLELRLASAFP